jgi:cellulose synthase/poly-beta-1,6-N-acetylglucosamine synthase-like glycosyltransferase
LGTQKGKRERSKAMTIMLLPMLFVIFFIGWVMYWMGDKRKSDRITQKSPKEARQPRQENVTFTPIVFEEPEEIASS